MTQTPDTAPGFYYVTMRDDAGRTALLAGPFRDDHARALAMVGAASMKAADVRPQYWFNAFGTVRSETDLGEGKLNKELGL